MVLMQHAIQIILDKLYITAFTKTIFVGKSTAEWA